MRAFLHVLSEQYRTEHFFGAEHSVPYMLFLALLYLGLRQPHHHVLVHFCTRHALLLLPDSWLAFLKESQHMYLLTYRHYQTVLKVHKAKKVVPHKERLFPFIKCNQLAACKYSRINQSLVPDMRPFSNYYPKQQIPISSGRQVENR